MSTEHVTDGELTCVEQQDMAYRAHGGDAFTIGLRSAIDAYRNLQRLGPELLPRACRELRALRASGDFPDTAVPSEERRSAVWWRDRVARLEKICGEVADAVGAPRGSDYSHLPEAARALRAPVDVEAALKDAAGKAEARFYNARKVLIEHDAWRDVLRPHVEERVRLAREAEGLRTERIAAEQRAQASATAAESYERLYADALEDLTAARAEIDRLKGLLSEATGGREFLLRCLREYVEQGGTREGGCQELAQGAHTDPGEVLKQVGQLIGGQERRYATAIRAYNEAVAKGDKRKDDLTAEIERLTKERDAWKALAKAEAAWGTGEGSPGRTAAAHVCCAAKADLRALGIDPEAP